MVEHTRIGSESHGEESGITSRMHLQTGPGTDAMDDDRQRILSDLRDIAAGAAGRARETFRTTAAEAGRSLDERTGLLRLTRERPILSVGAAFSTGFIVAALTRRREGNWLVESARHQLRAIILSGVAAIVAHEVRSLAGADEGFGEMIESWLEGRDHHDDDFEP